MIDGMCNFSGLYSLILQEKEPQQGQDTALGLSVNSWYKTPLFE